MAWHAARGKGVRAEEEDPIVEMEETAGSSVGRRGSPYLKFDMFAKSKAAQPQGVLRAEDPIVEIEETAGSSVDRVGDGLFCMADEISVAVVRARNHSRSL